MAGSTHISTGNWVPLMDYAMRKGVSLSTLRRHIKANKVKYKVEDGRYLLWVESFEEVETPSPPRDDNSLLQNHLLKVTQDLKRAQEEIAELKTLIALYEEKIPPNRLNN
jgi:hypothetical protein